MMTDVQREILIQKMLDAPATLTDAELHTIAGDAELRDIYEVSAAVSSACMSTREYDAAEEWTRFSSRIRRKPVWTRRWLRVAAVAAVAVAIAGVVAWMARSTSSHRAPLVAEAGVQDVSSPTVVESPAPDTVAVDTEAPAGEPNVPGSAKPLRRHMAAEVELPCGAVPDEMDIDEYMRIQQARADNELATLRAEVVQEEYELMCELYGAGSDKEEMSVSLQKVIIQ